MESLLLFFLVRSVNFCLCLFTFTLTFMLVWFGLVGWFFGGDGGIFLSISIYIFVMNAMRLVYNNIIYYGHLFKCFCQKLYERVRVRVCLWGGGDDSGDKAQ